MTACSPALRPATAACPGRRLQHLRGGARGVQIEQVEQGLGAGHLAAVGCYEGVWVVGEEGGGQPGEARPVLIRAAAEHGRRGPRSSRAIPFHVMTHPGIHAAVDHGWWGG